MNEPFLAGLKGGPDPGSTPAGDRASLVGKILTGFASEEHTVILCVDENYDDSFLFGRALRQVAPTFEWRHVTTLHDARCYLTGEEPYENRNLYPLPVFVIADSKL